MRSVPAALFASLLAFAASARDVGFGVDAFNRVIPASAAGAAVFSPLSFEIDSVLFGEAVDTISRATYAGALHVSDEFAAEYAPLARAPFAAASATNSLAGISWARAFVFDEPRRVAASYRLSVQETYGAEVCRARPSRGVEAWLHARLGGAFADWRLPPLAERDDYAFYDLVAIDCEVAPSNAFKRVFPSMTVYRQPLRGGCDFYALVPKAGRPVSSIRARFTSATLREILSMSAVVSDPPVPVRLALPSFSAASTNDLAGAFSYFKFPTLSPKLFPKGTKPSALRQDVRFRLRAPAAAPDAVPIEGPFAFFIHDPAANVMPAAGVCPNGAVQP